MTDTLTFEIVQGDLIKMAQEGKFGAIGHGCNCFCRMKRGIAPKMAKVFGCDNGDAWTLEAKVFKGDIRKLGNAQTAQAVYSRGVWVYNLYTQYHWQTPSRFGIPLDYDALRLALRKMFFSCDTNRVQTVGLPKIGCGLAGGDEKIVFDIISEEYLKYANTFDLIIVEYDEGAD